MCDSDGPWAKNRVKKDENGNPVKEQRLSPVFTRVETVAVVTVDPETYPAFAANGFNLKL